MHGPEWSCTVVGTEIGDGWRDSIGQLAVISRRSPGGSALVRSIPAISGAHTGYRRSSEIHGLQAASPDGMPEELLRSGEAFARLAPGYPRTAVGHARVSRTQAVILTMLLCREKRLDNARTTRPCL